MNPTRTTPPCYNNTTLGNRLYAQRKGPNVSRLDGRHGCNAGHAGVIQQLSRRGFYLMDVDDADDVETLLMRSDQLHRVSVIAVNSAMSSSISNTIESDVCLCQCDLS